MLVDDSLLEDLLAGFSLIGQSGCSSLFLEEDTLPAMSREQLMKSSRWSRKMVAAKGMDSHAEGLNVVEETWATTMDEVQRGWLQGPFSQDEIRQRLGPLFVASPRFGLMQGEKCRPIDDMSISLVNAAFAAAYKLDLDGVDGISVMARTMIEAVADDGTVELELSDGSVMKGYLHPSFSVASARQLAGRTLDLEAAYKQLLVRESSLWCSALQVRRPSGSNAYFISQVLPFGASASVYAFNRVSRALHCVGTRLFSLVWSNYYDDFPQLDVAMAGEDATTTAEGLMDLLGWRYSKKENKRLPMSLSFSALGVVFDFQAAQEGKVIVRNKESRAEQIYEEITKILQLGTFTSAQAASLRGKLQFAESQTFSRAVALHMRECHARANQAGPSPSLNPGIVSELEWAKAFVLGAHPRVLCAHSSENKVVIFTDAFLAEDDTLAGIGMVAYAVRQGRVAKKFYMSERVPPDVLKEMQSVTSKVIAALELYAAVASVELLCGV